MAESTTTPTVKKNNATSYLSDEMDGVGYGLTSADSTGTSATNPNNPNQEVTVSPENPVADPENVEADDGTKIYTGLFNFQDAFDSVNAWDPGDDEMANAAQAGMMMDYIQSGIFNLAAKDLAYTN